MKKISLFFIAVAGLAAAAKSQIYIAPEAGLNMATMAMKVNDLAGGSYTYSTALKPGLIMGMAADIGFTRSIHFQPGLFYDVAGVKFTNPSYINPSGQWNVNTITVPLNFEYETGYAGGNRFFAGLGPYIAYNVMGSYSYEYNQAYNYVGNKWKP